MEFSTIQRYLNLFKKLVDRCKNWSLLRFQACSSISNPALSSTTSWARSNLAFTNIKARRWAWSWILKPYSISKYSRLLWVKKIHFFLKLAILIQNLERDYFVDGSCSLFWTLKESINVWTPLRICKAWVLIGIESKKSFRNCQTSRRLSTDFTIILSKLLHRKQFILKMWVRLGWGSLGNWSNISINVGMLWKCWENIRINSKVSVWLDYWLSIEMKTIMKTAISKKRMDFCLQFASIWPNFRSTSNGSKTFLDLRKA